MLSRQVKATTSLVSGAEFEADDRRLAEHCLDPAGGADRVVADQRARTGAGVLDEPHPLADGERWRRLLSGTGRAARLRPHRGREDGADDGFSLLLLLLLLLHLDHGVVDQVDVDDVRDLDIGDVVDLTDDQLEVIVVSRNGLQVSGLVV